MDGVGGTDFLQPLKAFLKDFEWGIGLPGLFFALERYHGLLNRQVEPAVSMVAPSSEVQVETGGL